MDHDPMDDLPEDARREVVAAVRVALDIDQTNAEDIVRSTEQFWDAMERAGGLVGSWGGREFCSVPPRVLVFIREAAWENLSGRWRLGESRRLNAAE